MKQPLVTVICTCFNHERFVGDAINSVLQQTYDPIELIVVDDNSTDNSVEVIHNILKDRPDIEFLANTDNLGICKSFNKALDQSNGEYLIDLAADDLLEPQRVERGIEAFITNPKAGVNFCDTWYINEFSAIIRQHYKRDKHGKLGEDIPQGMIYKDILERYFICPPTMMFTRKAIETLGGYDEELAYEDFDFQIRSSRLFEYSFTDELLVKKRLLKNSLSRKQYKPNSRILMSTWKICEKAYTMNEAKEEHEALKKRIFYELRQAILSQNYDVAEKFLCLLDKMDVKDVRTWGYHTLLRIIRLC